MKGILWHQGESNQDNPDAYFKQLTDLVNNLREDLGNAKLPFVAGEIAQWNPKAGEINSKIRVLPAVVEHTGYISSVGAQPLKDYSDPHFSRDGSMLLGKRYAAKILQMVYGITDETSLFRDPDAPVDERVEDLLRRLTLEEKVGLMNNSSSPVSRLGIPEYNWWNEALHGVARVGRATVFPQAVAMAATFDEKALYETFTMISDEARAKYNEAKRNGEVHPVGLTFWTPNINIFRDPRWGRGMETYGEDPYLTERMGVAEF